MADTTQPTTDTTTLENPTPVIPVDPSNSLSFWESIAAFFGKFINDETAVGKAGKVAKWGVLSVIVIALLTTLASPTVASALVALHWGGLVVVANILIIFLKNLSDSGVKKI
jgi:hypothetical protein